MAAPLRSSVLDPFFLNLDTMYQQGYMEGESTYEQWAQTVTSTGKSTVHGWMDKFPKLREWVGPRVVETIVAQVYSLTNKKFELTVGVSRTDIEDDLLNLYAPTAQMMGMQAKEWPDDQMTPVLEAGPTSLTFDGADFFSQSHPIDTAGETTTSTQSNLYTTNAFGAANLATARANMRNLKGRDNKPLGMNLKAVMVPPALEQAALQLANTEYIVAAFGANAATGSQTNVLKGSFTPIVNAKLTSATTWYGFDNRWPMKALIWQLRIAPDFTLKVSPESENVFNDDQYLMGVRARGVGGYGLWFMACQNTA
jgi:phage major head subunit gpT-like protein